MLMVLLNQLNDKMIRTEIQVYLAGKNTKKYIGYRKKSD